MRTAPDAATDTEGGARPDPSAAHLELHRVLLGTDSLAQVLERVAQLGRSAVPGIDEVSVTLVEDGKARTAVFTSDLAVQLDERQYEDGFGPCLDAARTGRLVMLPDTATDSAYPGFARQAVRAGVSRTLSVGLPVQGRVVGALNVYGRSGTGWDDLTVAMADGFAAHAAIAVANAALFARTADEVEQMRAAMATRSVIEQAKGMVMAARRCSEDEAFAELRQRSTDDGRKLRDVARDLVDSHGDGL